ncbi:hypothetical protein FKM82_021407 [Ascaphus truei]
MSLLPSSAYTSPSPVPRWSSRSIRTTPAVSLCHSTATIQTTSPRPALPGPSRARQAAPPSPPASEMRKCPVPRTRLQRPPARRRSRSPASSPSPAPSVRAGAARALQRDRQ